MTPEDDQLAPARGFCWGIAFAVPFWIVVLLVVGLVK